MSDIARCFPRAYSVVHCGVFFIFSLLYESSYLQAQEKIGSQLKIAFLSCVQDQDTAPWKTLIQEKPDYVFMLGDNVYVHDIPNPTLKGMRAIYYKLFSNPDFALLRKNSHLHAIWDDHDFGPNNFDSQFSGLEAGKQLFYEYFGRFVNPLGLENTSAFALRLPGVLVLGTDNRSFRINPPKPGSSMFGEKQLQWLEHELLVSKERFTIVLSGNQILPEIGRTEALAKYPSERLRILRAFAASKAQVIVLSGDAHFADMHQVHLEDKDVYEFTSSPFSGSPDYRRPPREEPTRMGMTRVDPNYGILFLDSMSGIANVEFKNPLGKVIMSATTTSTR